MRSIKVKFTTNGETFATTLANPLAAPGDNDDSSVQVREIVNVPDSVSSHRVLQLWNETVDATMYGSGQRFTFDFAEIGGGKMIR